MEESHRLVRRAEREEGRGHGRVKIDANTAPAPWHSSSIDKGPCKNAACAQYGDTTAAQWSLPVFAYIMPAENRKWAAKSARFQDHLLLDQAAHSLWSGMAAVFSEVIKILALLFGSDNITSGQNCQCQYQKKVIKICKLYHVSADYLLGLTRVDPFQMERQRQRLTSEELTEVQAYSEYLLWKRNTGKK